MDLLTISEFKKFISDKNIKNFFYDSSNQNSKFKTIPIISKHIFSIMNIFSQHCSVVFYDSIKRNSIFTIRYVKKIMVNHMDGISGYTFYFICDDINHPKHKNVVTITAY